MEYVCVFSPEVPSLLKGEPGRLRQILVNLADNAVKFAHCGEIVIYVNWERHDDTRADIPLFGQIDLLVVDEAGQAFSEVAAAGFSLAQKALIVGDTDQIEPVWSVPACIDRSNLKRFNLLKNDQSKSAYSDFWLDSGLLAGCGNVMRVAQRQCCYHQFEQLQRGLYLTEHRRCYDSIIQYCNDLVYKGVLEHLRGDPHNGYPWPRLGFSACKW